MESPATPPTEAQVRALIEEALRQERVRCVKILAELLDQNLPGFVKIAYGMAIQGAFAKLMNCGDLAL